MYFITQQGYEIFFFIEITYLAIKSPNVIALPSRYAVSSVLGNTVVEISFKTLTDTVVDLCSKLGISCVVVATSTDSST